MHHQRYDFKQEPDGSWAVIDIFTGQPTEVDGITITGLDIEEADDMVDLLNTLDRIKQGGER